MAPYLVQVPEACDRVIPNILSMRDDFPALWDPKTTMMGILRLRCALREETKELRGVVDDKMVGVLTPSREGN